MRREKYDEPEYKPSKRYRLTGKPPSLMNGDAWKDCEIKPKPKKKWKKFLNAWDWNI